MSFGVLQGRPILLDANRFPDSFILVHKSNLVHFDGKKEEKPDIDRRFALHFSREETPFRSFLSNDPSAWRSGCMSYCFYSLLFIWTFEGQNKVLSRIVKAACKSGHNCDRLIL